MADTAATTRQKALSLNLDGTTYGTFAEIGGGQEVARWFFSVGGAAGTVAKTISAYDMAVSDALYGPTKRYVSRQRLEAMLEHEFAQLRERLEARRAATPSDSSPSPTPWRRAATGTPGPAAAGSASGSRPARTRSRPRSSSMPTCSTPTAAARAGGAGRTRRQPDPRRLLPPGRPGGPDRLAAGRPVPRAGRGRHDQALGAGLPGGGQPAHEPAAGGAGADRRGHVHGERRGRAAVGGALQEAGPGRAVHLPAGHEAHARPARPGDGAVPRGAGRPRRAGPSCWRR